MQLTDLGWDSFFEAGFKSFQDQGFSAMRIIREDREKYIASSEQGEFVCKISGKFRFETNRKAEFPAVGDWAAVSVQPEEKKAVIHGLLPRRSAFSRKVPGKVTEEQVVAANIDTVCIVTGLDLNFNVRRIERYVTMVLEGGAVPVILLNKADLCPEAEDRKHEVASKAAGIGIHTLSASNKAGMEIFDQYIAPGKTIAFIGSSGVGKSTIINALLGTEQLEVNEVSEEGDQGRHTTAFRELFLLPNGGMVIDTPGMRELQVWGDEEGLKQVFDDIEELALHCRFRNCSHQSEPGCAVQEATQNGSLEPKRLESYLKLQKEFARLAERQMMKPSAYEKSRWKKISQAAKNARSDKK